MSGLIAYVMIGVPGSGKTYIREKLLALNPGLNAVCPDDIRLELWGNAMDTAHHAETFGAMYADIATIWVSALDVVVDATHVSEGSRRERAAFLRRLGYDKVIAIIMLTPLEVCLERNASRERTIPEGDLVRMYDTFVSDQPDDTLYDDVWYIAP